MGAYAVGKFSGAHLNPAVTIALAMDGGFSWAQVPGYIICQMLGGIVGGCTRLVNVSSTLESH